MKKPLKEMLKKIGGGHLLKEYNDKVANYSDALGKYIQNLRLGIRVWVFSTEYHYGSWAWTNKKFENHFYATWGWEGKNEIPLETSDGDAFKAVKLKLKVGDPEDEKQLKDAAKKYINVMKKEFPKIEKKLLEY